MSVSVSKVIDLPMSPPPPIIVSCDRVSTTSSRMMMRWLSKTHTRPNKDHLKLTLFRFSRLSLTQQKLRLVFW